MTSSAIEERVSALLTDPISRMGVDLIDVEFTGGTLRVLIDIEHEPLTGGVDTETLADVNRAIGPILDDADPIPGRYTLEVSSPGVERRLARPDHYRRAIGEEVVVKLAPGVADHRRIKGVLTVAGDDTFEVAAAELDGRSLTDPLALTVAYDQVERTKTVFDWGPAPKPRSNSKKKKKKRGTR